jgi:hypothetical protein
LQFVGAVSTAATKNQQFQRLILKMLVDIFCYPATKVAATFAKSTRGAPFVQLDWVP